MKIDIEDIKKRGKRREMRDIDDRSVTLKTSRREERGEK